jgi:hypothetical protein
MSKNAKIVSLALMGCLLIIGLLFFIRDRSLTSGTERCGDPEGPRPTIDLRHFETDYTGYSVSLDAEITGKGKLAGRIEPAALQKLSESIQTGQEFRKALVAGYNACAVTRAYQAAVLRFQALDGLARQIDALAEKTSLSQDDHNTLTTLVDQYSKVARNLGDGAK